MILRPVRPFALSCSTAGILDVFKRGKPGRQRAQLFETNLDQLNPSVKSTGLHPENVGPGERNLCRGARLTMQILQAIEEFLKIQYYMQARTKQGCRRRIQNKQILVVANALGTGWFAFHQATTLRGHGDGVMSVAVLASKSFFVY